MAEIDFRAIQPLCSVTRKAFKEKRKLSVSFFLEAQSLLFVVLN